MSLRFRIFVVLGLLMAVTVGGGTIMLWYGTRLQSFFTGIFERQVYALESAMRLQSSLAAQRGFLTYYSLDQDPTWLDRLREQHGAFERELSQVRGFVEEPRSRLLLNSIESEFLRLTMERERVAELINTGDRGAAAALQSITRKRFEHLLGQCDGFLDELRDGLERDRTDGLGRLQLVNNLAVIFLPFTLFLGVVLAVVLYRQILGPIRRLAGEGGETVAPDEVAALENRMHGLIERVGQARVKLEKSQATLMAAERLASVGKMAAGVAHSIRNPLTSVKMRLFSLQRTLNMGPNEQEDFEVIAAEIKHLDTIIQNFLEYARPPKLQLRRVSPSEVVDAALNLLRHRLEGQGVDVVVERDDAIRPILLDPEQLKEVLVNLMANALDAMEGSGHLVIVETEGFIDPMGRVGVLTLTDSGPGVPEDIRESIFEPFFTTKDEGTGLGLPIVRRIVEGHNGVVNCSQAKGGGAKFTIILPFDAQEQGGARWH